MLVQNPAIPCFAVTGDYCPSTSTRSTHTQPFPQLIGLPVPIRLVFNNPEQSISQSHFSLFPTGQSADTTQSHHHQQVSFTGDCFSNIITPVVAVNMPRHSRSNDNHQEIEAPLFTEPLGPVAATGCKRDASALSANCTIPPITTTTTTANLPLDSNDQCTIYLPPKPKESERMMHIQRWVNHLPWNANNICDASGRTHVPYPIPLRPHIDEDRELTPPPGRNYLTRLPFTAEEQQAMVRFFPSHTNQYRHQHQGHAVPDPQPRYQHPFPNHCPNQQTSNNNNNNNNNNNHHFSSSQRPSQEAGNVFTPTGVRHMPEYINENSRKRGQEDVTGGGGAGAGGSRLFADWETRLISRLFKEFFHGNPKPTGVCGTLPSLSEVRSRIASSKLKETRTPTAVRSKIRRMQSSGTWLKYQ
ncbi:unnamed protein product [Trichobilharzia szidati]|nr:unnamed protein product [Trichobilharzia szidati]